MQTIQLSRGEWTYDPEKQLGQKGGFGNVYEGLSTDYGSIAVKLIHAERMDLAHRELRFADDFVGRSFSHVIPIIDAGLDAATDSYCIVMPRAERSLKDLIESTGQLDEAEAVPILLDIARGLSEVPNIVHRDLKPANVLFHEGQWKLADFGIARLMDEATSDQTLRAFRAPPYASPEQWKEGKVTKATDVYALGCIAYTLLLGRPPFAGPDFRDQHCTEQPPKLLTSARRTNRFRSFS